MENTNFENQFEKIFSDSPDCVCSGINAYENVIKEIFELTDGLLVLSKFQGINEKGRDYKLLLEINNENYLFEFEGSGYFHQDLLVDFNKIIKKIDPNETRNLFDFDGFGYDFAVVFAEAELEYKLAKEGLIWRGEDWISDFEQNRS